MKINLVISFVLTLALRLQQLLGKTSMKIWTARSNSKWWQQKIYNRTLNGTLRRTRLYNTKINIYKKLAFSLGGREPIKMQLGSWTKIENCDQDDWGLVSIEHYLGVYPSFGRLGVFIWEICFFMLCLKPYKKMICTFARH